VTSRYDRLKRYRYDYFGQFYTIQTGLTMRFSIIIPTLNEADTIKTCLNRLQTLRTNTEIILVDGGSHDLTTTLAQSLVDKIIISSPGRSVQMNGGAGQATGEILIFLHADTVLPDQALQPITASITPSRQWGRFDIELTGRHALLPVIAFFMNLRSRLTGIATGDQVIFISKALFDSIGQFPPIALMEDIALCKTLKKISPPLCLKAKVISSGRRWEQFGVIKTILLMWSLRLRYFFRADPNTLASLYYRGKFWKI
jgi:rSAM/selenodomain-associated transferase 2